MWHKMNLIRPCQFDSNRPMAVFVDLKETREQGTGYPGREIAARGNYKCFVVVYRDVCWRQDDKDLQCVSSSTWLKWGALRKLQSTTLDVTLKASPEKAEAARWIRASPRAWSTAGVHGERGESLGRRFSLCFLASVIWAALLCLLLPTMMDWKLWTHKQNEPSLPSVVSQDILSQWWKSDYRNRSQGQKVNGELQE